MAKRAVAVAQMKAQAAALALAQQAATERATAQIATATIQIPENKPLLMLPAPVKDPWMAELEALAAARKSRPAESPFVPLFTKSPAARSR